MENKISKILFNTNFVKRALSAFVIMPVMITPILLSEYILIPIYLILLSFVIEEIINIIKRSHYKIFPVIYLIIASISILSFIILLLSQHFKELFILIIFTIWLFDTFSYLGGSIIKGKKIFPKISQGKTYSGLLTGLISVLIIYYVAKDYFNIVQLLNYCSIMIIIILSFLGDIIVSLLKRAVKMKDSGNLIPGHGGFLDRLDSFIFVFFFIGIYFFLVWIKKIY